MLSGIRKYLISVFVIIMIPLRISDTDNNGDFQNNAELREYLKELREVYEFPAISAVVVSSDRIIAASAYGLRHMNREDRVTVNDKFHIGSCTKSITAVIAGMLVKEGKISWDSRVRDIFQEKESSMHRDLINVTLKDLLNHRAGIEPFNTINKDHVPELTGNIVERRFQFSAWQLGRTPHNRPGTFKYSNAGYDIAGAMLERITGRSWEELVMEMIFVPLNMRTAGFGIPAADDPDQPWGHWQRWRNETPTEPVSPDYNTLPDYEAPSGDVYMSILDCAKYLQVHLKGLRGIDGFVSSDLIKKLHNPVGNYAMGWFVDRMYGMKASRHGGSNGLFVGGFVICHDKDLAVAVFANSSTESANNATGKSIRDLLRKY
ncbi:MAG: beta-lactamase family protein [bacterium]|nr:beta-lactamase family protein [bacterium]